MKINFYSFFPLFVLLCLLLGGCTPERNAESSNSQREIDVFYDNLLEGGAFELPVVGASAYASMELMLYGSARVSVNVLGMLQAGQGFTILAEEGEWWFIDSYGLQGWVRNSLCMINLPDIIPSIVYDVTNTYSSMFRSSFIDIPNITGRSIYNGRDFNARFGREEFIAPVLYGMAPKIFNAQQAALAEGNTLVLYEAFRPADAHNELHYHFSNLVEANPLVRTGITSENFNIRWFLAEAPYNHQRGTAVDVSLARIDDWEVRTSGNYVYLHILEYTEYPMQTPIHELSVAAAIMSSSIYSRSSTGWHGAEISPRATPGTLLLFRYCTEAGLTPLSSEWWHFNDIENTALATDYDLGGEFLIESTYSRPPLR